MKMGQISQSEIVRFVPVSAILSHFHLICPRSRSFVPNPDICPKCRFLDGQASGNGLQRDKPTFIYCMIPAAFELFAKMLLTKPIRNQNTRFRGSREYRNRLGTGFGFGFGLGFGFVYDQI